MDISINDKIVKLNKTDFPMLINGQAFVNSGASFFSVSLMTELAKSGEKIIFFTRFPPAKELFKEQINNIINNNIIIIDSGDEDNFMNELNKIIDLDDRIILFKNIEEYSVRLFHRLENQRLIIFSGDIDKCVFGESLLKKDFKNKIFFSYPNIININNKIELPKYNGHIIGNRNGLIKLNLY